MSPVAGASVRVLRITLFIALSSFTRRRFDERPKKPKGRGNSHGLWSYLEHWTAGSTMPTVQVSAKKKSRGASAPTASEIRDEKRSYRSPGALVQSTIALQGTCDLYAIRLNLLLGCDVPIIPEMTALSTRILRRHGQSVAWKLYPCIGRVDSFSIGHMTSMIKRARQQLGGKSKGMDGSHWPAHIWRAGETLVNWRVLTRPEMGAPAYGP